MLARNVSCLVSGFFAHFVPTLRDGWKDKQATFAEAPFAAARLRAGRHLAHFPSAQVTCCPHNATELTAIFAEAPVTCRL